MGADQPGKSLAERVAAVVREEVALVPYDPGWPRLFEREAAFLRSVLPPALVRRIEHFGSTAVPGLTAKPIIDMLVEVSSLEVTRKVVAPILEARGYDYFWRPEFDLDQPPYYAWFIKRDTAGARTHHIHMVEADSGLWDRLLFRDYLREFPEVARSYGVLKQSLAEKHPKDRVAYTKAKGDFIVSVTEQARRRYASSR